MNKNMGRTDRMLRAGIVAPALVLVAVFAGVTSGIGVTALVLAAVMLATSALGSCPLYQLFGVDTCSRAGSR